MYSLWFQLLLRKQDYSSGRAHCLFCSILGIYTAAVEMLAGKESREFSRKPEIMADAAYAILTQDPKTCTGNFFIDDEILTQSGVKDMVQYACVPENVDKLIPDLFVDSNAEYFSGGQTNIGSFMEAGKKTESEGEIAKLFYKIECSISPDTVSKTQAVFAFEVTGDEPGKW